MASVFDKYGVPNDNSQMESQIQPKLQYRFKIEFDGMGGVTDTFAATKNVVDVTIPTFEQEPVQIDSYVSRYYVAGKHTLGTFNVNLRNDANNTVSGLIQAQLDRQHNAFHQSHAPTAGAIKFNTKIMMLNGSNGDAEWPQGGGSGAEIMEAWFITGCWITNVEWGSLNYGTSDPVQIALTLRPDNVFHITNAMGTSQDVSYTNSTALESFEFQDTVDGNNSAV